MNAESDATIPMVLHPAGWLAVAVVLLIWMPAPMPGQSAGDGESVERARHLVERGEYAESSVLLGEYLQRYPDRPRVRWLRARTLYWQGRVGAARREYRRALEGLPGEAALRVDYGRLLVETGRRQEAREVLRPVLEEERPSREASVEADVRALLGKMAYWSGDYGGARGHLERALETDPGRSEARRILTEIQRMDAPWLSLGGTYRDDSQPLRERSLTLEAGVPLSHRVALSLRAVPHQLAGSAGDWRGVPAATGGLRVDWPGPLESRVEAGRLRHVSAARTGWIGQGELSARLGAGFSLGAGGQRWNYRHTAGVLDTALFVESASVRLRRERPSGWGGQLGGRVERFPDGNRIRSGHLWLLAPVWSDGGDAFRLGYAFRAADSDESTFRPASSSASASATGAASSHRPGPPFGGSTGSTDATAADGTYSPYYTPEEVRSHSAVAALQVRAGPDVTMSADGAVGIHATERVPASGSSATALTWIRRDFRPWRLRGQLGVEPSRSTELHLQAGYREDAFYEVFEASVRWTYRFLGSLPGE